MHGVNIARRASSLTYCLDQATIVASDWFSSSNLVAMQPIKQRLYNLCCEYVTERIAEAMQAIADTQEAVNNETKSTAGDKYETSREMMQQEINRDASRLYEMKKLQAALHLIGRVHCAHQQRKLLSVH